MDTQRYWSKKLGEYAEQDWVNKPSIFAEQSLGYLPSQGKILDLAGGQGNDSKFFAEKGYQVTYSDFVEEIVQRVKEIANPTLDMTFRVIDLKDHMPFKNNSFDIIYSHMGLHYFGKEKTQSVFEEIHRVLKSDGIIAVLLNTIDDPEIKQHNYEQIEPHFFLDPRSHLKKSYFSVEYVKELTNDLFEPLLIDNKGETYKDEVKTLVRFIGKCK